MTLTVEVAMQQAEKSLKYAERSAQPKYSGFDAMSCHDGDPISVYALKQAYRKHALNDGSIGWNELQDTLYNALAQIMGDVEFVEWSDSAKHDINESQQ